MRRRVRAFPHAGLGLPPLCITFMDLPALLGPPVPSECLPEVTHVLSLSQRWHWGRPSLSLNNTSCRTLTRLLGLGVMDVDGLALTRVSLAATNGADGLGPRTCWNGARAAGRPLRPWPASGGPWGPRAGMLEPSVRTRAGPCSLADRVAAPTVGQAQGSCSRGSRGLAPRPGGRRWWVAAVLGHFLGCPLLQAALCRCPVLPRGH